MQDIFINIPEQDKRRKTILYTLLVLGYVGAFAVMAGSGDGEAANITQIDPMDLLLVQGIISGVFFILLPILLFTQGMDFPLKGIFQAVTFQQVLYVVVIGFSGMVVLSVIIEWNMSIVLPVEGFQSWARAKENELKELTEHIINFKSTTQFIVAFIVVAVFAAIGEEILFRGLLQNLLARVTGNVHIAIWVSAILFSAIHLQFFGFFPRLLLGALFGYLYYWSGRLSIAMIAHFFNNGLSITAAYISGLKIESIPITNDQLDKAAPWPVILFFLVLGTVALLFFKINFHRNEQLA